LLETLDHPLQFFHALLNVLLAFLNLLLQALDLFAPVLRALVGLTGATGRRPVRVLPPDRQRRQQQAGGKQADAGLG
jgi:hypothetical protein